MQQLTTAIQQFAENQLQVAQPHSLYDQLLQAIEKPYIERMLREFHGNQTKCAEALGLNRATLRVKLKRYDLL